MDLVRATHLETENSMITQKQVDELAKKMDGIETDEKGRPTVRCDDFYNRNFVTLDECRRVWRTKFDESKEVGISEPVKEQPPKK